MFDEFDEGSFQRVKIAVVIEVLRIDICDYSHGRRQFHERAVGLVGLYHHPFAAAEPGVGAVRVDDAAIDDRWIKLSSIEDRGNNGCCRRLAMGAGNRNAPFEPHDFRQHLGSAAPRGSVATAPR